MSDQVQTEAETAETKESSFAFYEASIADARHPDRNEDTTFHNGRDLAMVFDGAGGIKGGKTASNSARHFLSDNLLHRETDLREANDFLKKSVEECSATVRAESNGGLTTGVVAKIVEQDGYIDVIIASVGDSRAYLLKGDILEQITEDDSGYGVDVMKKISSAQKEEDLVGIERIAFRNRFGVTQFLGQDDDVEVHGYSRELKPGNKLILTTDGVHDNLTDDEILEIVKESGDVAQKLVDNAKKRSESDHFRAKPDDISAVVVEVK